MTLLRWAGAIALALCSCAPSAALAQHARSSAAPAGFAPEYVEVVVPATSTAQEGNVTPTTATATSGVASITNGVAAIGPLVPQLGRGIRVVLRGTWAGTFQLGTSSSANACATFNPLTVAGQTWGSFTANANEVVDVPTLADVVYCARATITSGSLDYAVRQ